MWTDPIVEEIRTYRRQLAEQFGNDVHKICEDIRQRERDSGREYVSLPPRPPISTAIPVIPLTPIDAPNASTGV
jgi:hypothetical protein